MAAANKMDDPGQNLALEKLRALKDHLNSKCNVIQSQIEDKRISEETRRLLKEKLMELKRAQIEIGNLQQRLMRL
jgi:hypothetical protein